MSGRIRGRNRALSAALAVGFCAAAVLVGCKKGGSVSQTSTRPGAPGYDERIAEAWNAADRLRKAWTNKDFEAARPLASPRLLQHREEALRDFVEGLPNHVHRECRIVSGRRREGDRVEFTFELTVDMKGQFGGRVQESSRRVTLGEQGGKWMIDELSPLPAGPGG